MSSLSADSCKLVVNNLFPSCTVITPFFNVIMPSFNFLEFELNAPKPVFNEETPSV